jgi:hypothetical protein
MAIRAVLSVVNTGWFYIIVGVSVTYNSQTGSNKIKLLTEYESVAQKALFGNAIRAALIDWLIDVGYTFIFCKQFRYVISGLTIIGHGNPDSNLESSCRLNEVEAFTLLRKTVEKYRQNREEEIKSERTRRKIR